MAACWFQRLIADAAFLLALCSVLLWHSAEGFVSRSRVSLIESCPIHSSYDNQHNNWSRRHVNVNLPRVGTTTNRPQLSVRRAVTIPTFLDGILSSVVAKKSMVLLVASSLIAVFLSTKGKQILWPRSAIDPAVDAPVPPGSFGCPLFGHKHLGGNKKFGNGWFFHKMCKSLGYPRLWKTYFFAKARIMLVGGEKIQRLFNTKEFEPDGVNSGQLKSKIMGKNNILNEQDKHRHAFLRRLIGSAVTPSAIKECIPNLQASAEAQVKCLLDDYSSIDSQLDQSKTGLTTKAAQICDDYAMDIAWKQILGLDLNPEEVPLFRTQVKEFTSGFFNPRMMFNIAKESSKPYQAQHYLYQKIEERIDVLQQGSGDTSTLSRMLLATDDEQNERQTGRSPSTSSSSASEDSRSKLRKLTKQEVMDNSLVLIFAGSETSSSTLANALFFLGLHPEIWEKLVLEQQAMRDRHGDVIDKDILDRECPYLEAVILETMRIKPIPYAKPRSVKKTFILDGYQIPKGWGVVGSILNTHELDPTTYRDDFSHMHIQKGFVPERWLEASTRPKADFVPFGAGPRRCLGANLAIAEMQVFLAVLARNIEFELENPGMNLEWEGRSIIPKLTNGVPIIVRPNIAAASMT